MTADLLLSLQLGDSAYPSGAFAFSWGLEGAVADGQVDRSSFGAWVEAELLHRWARFDRPVLAGAWSRQNAEILKWDAEVDCLFWAEPLRRHSAEAGGAFLSAASRLGSSSATAMLKATDEGQAVGHLAVAQGAVYAELGLPLDHALATSAYAAAQALSSAGVRLSLISAFDGQRVLTELRPSLSTVLAEPFDARPASFAPITEIAMLRPIGGRLFVN